jgi:hypothetical protein
VKVINNNFKGLSQLCEEFRFRDLTSQLSQFPASEAFKKDAEAQMTEIKDSTTLFVDQDGRSFSEMSQVVLVHPLRTFKVSARLIVFKCDLFTDNPGLAASPHAVRSPVSLADFGEFVSLLEGNAIAITNDNIKGLSALCDESFRRFGFGAGTVSRFSWVQRSGNSNRFRSAKAPFGSRGASPTTRPSDCIAAVRTLAAIAGTKVGN